MELMLWHQLRFFVERFEQARREPAWGEPPKRRRWRKQRGGEVKKQGAMRSAPSEQCDILRAKRVTRFCRRQVLMFLRGRVSPSPPKSTGFDRSLSILLFTFYFLPLHSSLLPTCRFWRKLIYFIPLLSLLHNLKGLLLTDIFKTSEAACYFTAVFVRDLIYFRLFNLHISEFVCTFIHKFKPC